MSVGIIISLSILVIFIYFMFDLYIYENKINLFKKKKGGIRMNFIKKLYYKFLIAKLLKKGQKLSNQIMNSNDLELNEELDNEIGKINEKLLIYMEKINPGFNEYYKIVSGFFDLIFKELDKPKPKKKSKKPKKKKTKK